MAYLFWAWLIVIPAFVFSIVVGIIPGFLLKVVGLRKLGEKWTFWWGSKLSGFVIWLLGAQIHTSGCYEATVAKSKSGQPLCFVSNHTSIMDIPALLSLGVHCGFVAKEELRFVPGVNAWIMAIHSVFLNRKSLRKGVKSINKAVATVKKGCPMCIFPEGSRSKTGEIQSFKHGSFRLATESDSEIVPVTIKGLRVSFEGRKKCFQRTDCYIDFGTAIKAPSSSDRDAVSNLITYVEDSIKQKYAALPAPSLN
jgi:1-acyl-sn-glycerol-3-phosphate acyltransferase